MNMKISSLQIKCKSGNVFFQLSNKISFIYGNAGVGKTTLLNLINYALGNNLVKTLAVEQEVLGISLNVWMNGELINLERKINSNSIILTKQNEKISLIAKGGKELKKMTFSDYIYIVEGIEPIEMLRGNSSKEIKVNFSNFMWFSYLRQEELDNTLFYLGGEKGNHKEAASKYVMKVLLEEKEVSNKEIIKKINNLKEKQESVKLRSRIVCEICSCTKLFDINLSKEIVKKQREVLKIKQELESLKKILLEKNDKKEELVESLLERQMRIGRYEAEIRYLGEFMKINDVKKHYSDDMEIYSNKIHYYENLKENIENQCFEENIEKLEEIFLECLLDIGFSCVEYSDVVIINKKNFMPLIYSKYGEFKFDYQNLSSGGKKTIFKICYALAIHIYIKENQVRSIFPQFIIVDTPMKNISEREDRVLYENLYRFFLKLFSDGGILENTQLVVVDKELPNILKNQDIFCKHMTNEEPLIPYFKEWSV